MELYKRWVFRLFWLLTKRLNFGRLFYFFITYSIVGVLFTSSPAPQFHSKIVVLFTSPNFQALVESHNLQSFSDSDHRQKCSRFLSMFTIRPYFSYSSISFSIYIPDHFLFGVPRLVRPCFFFVSLGVPHPCILQSWRKTAVFYESFDTEMAPAKCIPIFILEQQH